MKKTTKIKSLMMAGVVSCVGLVGAFAAPSFAANTSTLVNGCPANWTKEHGTCVPPDSNNTDLWTTVSTVINVVLAIVGVIAVFMIILGGIQYSTSAGDPGKVKKAKDTILYGIIGLVIALLAYAIVNFVLSSVFTNS